MATRANYVKIGLFVMLGVGAALALALTAGIRSVRRETISYFSYFDEDVAGLEVGAPVKVRGVTVGQVGHITFAPDHRTVEVRGDVDVQALVRLGLRQRGILKTTPLPLPPDLRAQLATQGLIGTKYLAIDYFDPKTNPPPPLSFTPPHNYIPAARSIQKNLEEAATTAMTGLADLVDTLRREGTSEKLVLILRHVDDLLGQLSGVVKDFGGQELPERAAATLEELRATVHRVQTLIAGLDGKDGLLATTQHSVASIGEAGRGVSGTTRNLDDTLSEIRQAAESIRLFADELERQPDMMLKGRAQGKKP